MGKVQIAPSILAADFANIQEEVESINETSADLLHIDIMDGIFVPNISFGFPVTQAIQKHSRKPLDFHLMIQYPERYLDHCQKSGAARISIHLEASPHLHRTVAAIKEMGIQAGVAINPHTAVNNLKDIISDVDIVLLMSVNPGFGGQKFIEQTYEKIEDVRGLAADKNPDVQVEIDGGVTRDNAGKLISSGADVLVAGSSVFKETDRKAIVEELRSIGG